MNSNKAASKKGIMICGHGSRDKDAEREFGRVAKGLKKRFPNIPVEYGFLEFSAPNIHMGLDALRDQGVTEIYAVPGMLFAATHARNDIPSVLTTYEQNNAGITVQYGAELGLHPAMITAFQTRIYESLNLKYSTTELYDSLLVVVGRGTSDSFANAEVAKLTRLVNENMGFGWADTVYSGVTYPSTGVGLEKLIKLGFKQIVVAPYFLFTGRLIKRIYGYVDRIAAQNPEIEFIKTPYLNDHEKVIDAFEIRIKEIMQGKSQQEETLMTSFKKRLAAGEIKVHHHHAEYNPNNHDHDHDHEHDHSHNHSHQHDYYKHIGHPLGPRTMIVDQICCCFMSQFPQKILDEEAEAVKLANINNPLAHQ